MPSTDFINLTQHPSTAEQKQANILDLKGRDLKKLKKLLTFNKLPSYETLIGRARSLSFLAKEKGAKKVMIAGAPYLMSFLERELMKNNIKFVYAFSERRVKEEFQCGKLVKKSSFKHLGFIGEDY